MQLQVEDLGDLLQLRLAYSRGCCRYGGVAATLAQSVLMEAQLYKFCGNVLRNIEVEIGVCIHGILFDRGKPWMRCVWKS